MPIAAPATRAGMLQLAGSLGVRTRSRLAKPGAEPALPEVHALDHFEVVLELALEFLV